MKPDTIVGIDPGETTGLVVHALDGSHTSAYEMTVDQFRFWTSYQIEDPADFCHLGVVQFVIETWRPRPKVKLRSMAPAWVEGMSALLATSYGDLPPLQPKPSALKMIKDDIVEEELGLRDKSTHVMDAGRAVVYGLRKLQAKEDAKKLGVEI